MFSHIRDWDSWTAIDAASCSRVRSNSVPGAMPSSYKACPASWTVEKRLEAK